MHAPYVFRSIRGSGLASPPACRRPVLAFPSPRPRMVCNATHNIAVLPGDGIGPEIMRVAIEVLKAAGKELGEEFVFKEALIGGAAIDAAGDPFPDETYEICKASDAVLLAAIGGYVLVCVGLTLANVVPILCELLSTSLHVGINGIRCPTHSGPKKVCCGCDLP